MGEEAADRGAGDGRGEVHRREPFLVARPFKVLRDDARLGRHGERGLVDLDHLVHALHVEDDAVVDRQRPALRTRAAAPRDDGDPVLVRDLHDLRDLGRGAGVDDEVGLRALLAAVVPHLRDPVVVDRMAELVGELDVDVRLAHGVREFRANHLVHVAVGFDCHVSSLVWMKENTHILPRFAKTRNRPVRENVIKMRDVLRSSHGRRRTLGKGGSRLSRLGKGGSRLSRPGKGGSRLSRPSVCRGASASIPSRVATTARSDATCADWRPCWRAVAVVSWPPS